MAIAKKCLACNLYRDECAGSESGCGKWTEIDFEHDRKAAAVVADPVPEFQTEKIPNSGPVPEFPVEPIAEPFPAEDVYKELEDGAETLQQKFDRIGAKRQAQAMDAIRKLGHLASNYYRKRTKVTAYTYEWTAEQALEILRPIEAALNNLKAELLAPDMPREHGLIEEKSDV